MSYTVLAGRWSQEISEEMWCGGADVGWWPPHDKLNVSIKPRFASVFFPKMINCLETLAVRNLSYFTKT